MIESIQALITPVTSVSTLISITVVGIVFLLGFFVYINDRKALVNKIFFLLTIAINIWIVSVIIVFSFPQGYIGLFSARTAFGGATWIAFFAYCFAYYFPVKNRNYKLSISWTLCFSIGIFLFSTFTPFVIKNLSVVSGLQINTYGPGYYLFLTYFVGYISGAIFNLVSKRKILTDSQITQTNYILLGFAVSSGLGLITNLIIPAITENTYVSQYGPLMTVFLVIISSYAIIKRRLFSIKIIATEFLIFAIWIFLLIQTLFAVSFIEMIINGVLFILVVLFGILLIQSVSREVEQREKIELLNKDLGEANRKQEGLIHFITHEIKGFLAKSRNIFSMISEGDYGQMPEGFRVPVEEGFKSGTNGVAMVQEILSASDLKTGAVAYDMKPFDLKPLVIEIISEHKKSAEAKNLTVETNINDGEKYEIVGDIMQMKHVFKNLIDNSIKYTLKGGLKISLLKKGDKILFSVKDTGVGIKPEDKARLFTEGGKGKDSVKVNVDSTGYGLYIAKKITEAHHGRVWAESEGEGKGAEFFVELQAK